MFHQDLGLVKLLWLSRLDTAVSLHDFSKGLNLLFCSLILLALRPPVPSLSGRTKRTCGFFFLLAGCNRSLGYRQSRLKRRKETEGPKHQSRSKSSALPLRPERLHSFCVKEPGMRHKQQHKPKTHSKNQKHKQSKNTTTTTKEKSLIPRLNQT